MTPYQQGYIDGLRKQAIMGRTMNDDSLTATAIAIGIPLTGGLLAWWAMQSSLSKAKLIKAVAMRKLLRRSDMPSNMPIMKDPGFDNAAYFDDKEQIKDFIEERDFMGDEAKKKFLAANKMKSWNPLLKAKTPDAILYDPKFARYGIIGHELGHAKQEREGGMARFNQRYLRPIGSMAGTLGIMTAGLNPFELSMPGRVGLAAASSLGHIPTLVSEWLASAHAKKLIGEDKALTEEQKGRERSTLNRAFGTYLGGAVLPSVGMGAGLAYLANKGYQ